MFILLMTASAWTNSRLCLHCSKFMKTFHFHSHLYSTMQNKLPDRMCHPNWAHDASRAGIMGRGWCGDGLSGGRDVPRESSFLPRQTPAESEGHTRGAYESVPWGVWGGIMRHRWQSLTSAAASIWVGLFAIVWMDRGWGCSGRRELVRA